jgi:hypothetical protein
VHAVINKLCHQDRSFVGYDTVELGINVPDQPSSSMFRHIIFIILFVKHIHKTALHGFGVFRLLLVTVIRDLNGRM